MRQFLKYSILIVVLSAIFPAFGQTALIDSLKEELRKASDETARLGLLQKVTQKASFSNLDTAEFYGNRLLSESESLKNKDFEGKAYHALADIQRRRANYDSALVLAKKSEMLVKDTLQLIKVYNAIGNIYFNDDKYDEAEEYYSKIIALSREVGSEIDLYMNYNNLGMVYARKGEYPEALRVNFLALNVIDSLDLDVRTGSIYGVIGVIYQNMEHYKESYEYYKKAIAADSAYEDKMGVITWEINWGIALQKEGKYQEAKDVYIRSLKKAREAEYTRLEGNVLCNIGSLLNEAQQPDSASYYFHLAYELSDSIQATNLLAFSLRNLGRIHLANNNPNKAYFYLTEGHSLAYQINDLNFIRDIHGAWADYYELVENSDSAYHHYKIYTQYKDSISGEKKLMEIGKMEAQHDYERQKIIDDKETEKKLALQKQKQRQQLIVSIISISGAGLIFILLLIIYRRLRITRTQKVIIEEQKEEVESQRDQIESQKNLIEEKHSEIQESISYAKRIQEAILPQGHLINNCFPQNFVLYKPKDVVAGDFYWLEEQGDYVFFAAADCTGHGVPGAMVSVVCHGALNRSVREYGLKTPAEILDKTRELVIRTFEKSKEQVKDGMDICLCAWDRKNKTLQYAGANNPLYILIEGSTEIEIVKADKQPIGFDQDPQAFTNHVINLDKLEVLYLFTDGYADQFGGKKGKKLGYKRFRELLIEGAGMDMSAQSSKLLSFFEEWKGKEEQVDDVCIIGIKIK